MKDDNFSQTTSQEQEPIIFPDSQMKKKRKFAPAIIRGVIILLVVAFVGLYFYVHNFTRYFDPTGEIYRTDYNNSQLYISFSDSKTMQIYVSDSYYLQVARLDYRYSGYSWNHLVGNWYFSDKNLLSLKNVDNGAKPATVFLNLGSGYYFNGWGDEIEVNELNDDFETSGQFDLFFYSDSLIFGDLVLDKVDEIDSAIELISFWCSSRGIL